MASMKLSQNNTFEPIKKEEPIEIKVASENDSCMSIPTMEDEGDGESYSVSHEGSEEESDSSEGESSESVPVPNKKPQPKPNPQVKEQPKKQAGPQKQVKDEQLESIVAMFPQFERETIEQYYHGLFNKDADQTIAYLMQQNDQLQNAEAMQRRQNPRSQGANRQGNTAGGAQSRPQ